DLSTCGQKEKEFQKAASINAASGKMYIPGPFLLDPQFRFLIKEMHFLHIECHIKGLSSFDVKACIDTGNNILSVHFRVQDNFRAHQLRDIDTCLNFCLRGMLDKERFIVDVLDRKSTRLNSSHVKISYAVFCLKKK